MKELIHTTWTIVLAGFAISLHASLLLASGNQSIPDATVTGRELAAAVVGHFSHFPIGVSDKMPDGPIAGNGDVGLVLNGTPDQLRFGIGKSDFWGVARGSITRVGWMELNIPELNKAESAVQQNVGPATLTGRFTKGSAQIDFTSWVAASSNLVVLELHNTGTKPLNLSASLFDGLGTTGNEATFGASESSTWLKVSPDAMNVSVGNRLSMGPRGGFSGNIAGLKIFFKALPPSGTVDEHSEQPAIFHWPDSGDPSEHGPSAEFSGRDNAGMNAGALLIPQKEFTVTAWVKAASTADLNFILSTMTSVYGKNQYPFQRGFALNLARGCLSATLNYTTTTAVDLFPLNRWVKVAAIYDGSALTICEDGKPVATTTAFPGAKDVMGWDKKTIHTGDSDLPFAGCAPEGVMMQRIIGPPAKQLNQSLVFTLAPGERATLIVSVLTDRNSKDPLLAAGDMVKHQDLQSLEQLFKDHQKWWADFWSKSFIRIPDQKIQDNWYASLYLLACCSRADGLAPGLWGNFVTGDRMEWQGDYTLDYNYEAPFWAALPTNHMELADNYERALLDQIPRGEATASHYGFKGIYWYCHLTPVPGWSDDYGTFWGQKSGSLFAVVNCAQRWRYTGDPAYARRIYPLLKGVADFWDNYLVLKDGRYVDMDDSAGENTGHDTNPATTIAFLRLIYPCVIQISELLDTDADRREKWHDVLNRLSPLPILPANKISAHLEKMDPAVLKGNLFIRNSETGSNFPDVMYDLYQDHRQRHSSAGMNSTQVVFPGWCIGLESSDRDRHAAYNTLLAAAEWFDFNNDCTYYPAAAAIGIDPKLILANMHALLDSQTPNFICHTGGGGTENFAVVPATLSLMFLQSYQDNIHLFPNWPMEQDAAFGNLNACGGFLVSSQVTHSKVGYVKIQSNAGQECRIVNPWPGKVVHLSSDKRQGKDLNGELLKFKTQAGETVILNAGM